MPGSRAALVWDEPLFRLAPKLGLSDVDLAKILDRLEVPRPGVGFWMKKGYGKAALRPKIPAARVGAETSVTIRGSEAKSGPIERPSGILEYDYVEIY